MKIYLDDNGGTPAKERKASLSTTRRSSHSGGFKPPRGDRESFDSQGFGGAGKRGKAAPVEEDLPETDLTLGVVPEEDTEEDAYEVPGYSEEDKAPEDVPEEPTEDTEDEEPDPPCPKPRSAKEPKGSGKKDSLEKKSKKSSGGITISGPRKGSKKKAPTPMAKASKGKKASQPVGPSKKAAKPAIPKKSAKQKVDDFDANFGKGSKKYSEPAEGEPIASQLIGVIELIIGGGLMFFGASQLGNILINNILSKAIGG